MLLHTWHSKLLELLKQRNSHLLFAVGLLASNLIQLIIILCLAGNWHTIILPPNAPSYWLSHRQVSNSYLTDMTHYLADLALNVTPDSAKFQREEILKFTDPKGYGSLKAALIACEDNIKQKNIATLFYAVDVQVDSKQLSCIITGDLKTFVGQQLTSTQRLSYLARFRYHNGKLLVVQFEEVKKDAL